MPLSNTDPNQQPTAPAGTGAVLAPSPSSGTPSVSGAPSLQLSPLSNILSSGINTSPQSTSTGADPNKVAGQPDPLPGSTDKSPSNKGSGNVLNDIFYDMQVSMTGMRDVNKILNVQKSNEGTVNNYTNGSTIIINSDRLILNSKKDYLMLCGTKGVLVSSPKAVHIDCDEDLHLFSSNGEIFIGLPNKGKDYDFDSQTPPSKKSDATMNERWEPLPLGLKLINWLQDLTAALVGSAYYGPGGTSLPTPEMRDNIEGLAARLPEILSTIAFIDGVSHANPLPYTPSTEQKPADNKPADQAGSTTSGTGTATADGKPASTNTTTVSGASNPQSGGGGTASVSAGSAANAGNLENIELNTSTNNADGVVGSGTSTGQNVEGFTPAIDGGSLDISGITTKYFYITRQETIDEVTESQVEIMFRNSEYSPAGMSERSKTASKEDLLKQAFDNAKQSGITDCNQSTTTDAGVWDFSDVFFTIGEETDAPAAEPVALLSTSDLGSISVNIPIQQGFNSFGNYTPADIPTDFKVVVEDKYSTAYPSIINLLKNRTAMSHISKWDGANRSSTENQVAGVMSNFDNGILSVEIDLALDKLNQVLLYHDATLDSKTNATGEIRNWPQQAKIDGVDIAASDANWWQKVKYKNTNETLNKLSQVFDAMAANKEKYKNCFVQLDKCDGEELKVVASMLQKADRQWLRPQVIYKGRQPSDVGKTNNFTFMYKFNRGSMSAIASDAEVTKIRDQILDWKRQGHNVPLVELEFTCQDIKILDGTLAKALASIGTGMMIVAVGGAQYTQPQDRCIDKTRRIEPPPPQPGPNDPPLREDQIFVSYDFTGDGQDQWRAMVETGAIMIMTNKPKVCQDYLNSQNIALPIPFEITPSTFSGLNIVIKNKANAKLRTTAEIDDTTPDNFEVIAVQKGAISLNVKFWPKTDTNGAVIGGHLVGATTAITGESGIAGKAVTSGDIMKWVQNRAQYLPTNSIWKDVFVVVGPTSGITVDGVKIKPDSAFGLDQHPTGVKLEKTYYISLADMEWEWPQV